MVSMLFNFVMLMLGIISGIVVSVTFIFMLWFAWQVIKALIKVSKK